jgi:hypothetical protein
VKIIRTFDALGHIDALEVWGDTETKRAFVTVYEDDESCAAEISPLDLRALSVALLEVADRLDPPQPSLATLADRMFQSGFPL